MLLSHQNNLFEIITPSFCSIICMIASIEFWMSFTKEYLIERGMFKWIFAQIVVKNI